MKRFLVTIGLIALGISVALAQTPPAHQGMQHDPDKMVQGGGKLPPGWQARLDSATAKIESVSFETMGAGFHVKTGPAGVFYKPDQKMNAAYETHATFTQIEPSTHPEAYGLIIGGADLQGEGCKYTYFLIRQDGKFLIKRRAGAATPTVMNWTENAAIKKADESGKMTNALAIEVGKDKVRFLINGTEVASQPPAEIDTSGIAGFRVNHNLNVQIDNFGVKSAMSH
jgi:hypothetical protein